MKILKRVIEEMTMIGNQVRQQRTMDEIPLAWFFDMGEWDKDFLREMIEQKTLKDKIDLQKYIEDVISQLQLKMGMHDQYRYLIVYPCQSKSILLNIISYLKNCLVINKQLKDYIHFIQNYLINEESYKAIKEYGKLNLNLPQ